MNNELAGLSVLLVEDDPDTAELLALALERRGAECRLAASGTAAVCELSRAPAAVIVCDLSLPDGSGLDWLPKLRAIPGMAGAPAVAVSEYGSESARSTSISAGFAKHLTKPASLLDLITAITTLTSRSGPLALKPTLSRLADATGCRYTSFFRFERERLVSVWTYDRSNEAADAFPLELPIEASYCSLVKEVGELVVIEDAARDPRATGHMKQHVLATYAGAPVFGPDGVLFGTLCAYDSAPQSIGKEARTMLSNAARELELAIQST